MAFFAKIADEDWAHINLERLKESHPQFPWASFEKQYNYQLLRLIIGFSPYATNILVQNRNILDLFLQEPLSRPKGRLALKQELCQKLSQISDWREAALCLRKIKQREIIKILAYDLSGESLQRTVFAITSLAEALLEAALFWLEKSFESLTKSFIVFGMGKLGGRELNYSSDIDLIYFYHGPFTRKEEFVRLAHEFTKLITQFVNGEPLFRVDLRLRPSGKKGELIYSTKGGANYYFFQSHPFERLALIKARCCVGNRILGKKFLRSLRPVIYPRYLDYTFLEHISDLKDRLSKEAAKHGAEDNIKIGPGGIREIEFFCQTLQMIYGGKFPILCTRNTTWALTRLQKVGLISASEARVLKEAYFFLRTVEHRLQTIHFRQTAKLPKEEQALFRLARSLGFFGKDAIAEFQAVLKTHRKRVREIFDGLLSPKSKPLAKEKIHLFISDLKSKEPAIEIAREYDIPLELIKDLKNFIERKDKSFLKKKDIFYSLLPTILEETFAIENGRKALSKFLSFFQRLGGRISFFHAMQYQPETVRHLFLIFSKSAFLTNLLSEAPLAAEALFEPEPLKEEIKRTIRNLSYEDALSFLRTFKNETIFRIGFDDLRGKLDLSQLLYRLSWLAIYVIQETYRIAKLRLQEELKQVFPGKFVVFGMGKLGSQELGYRSDLDMVFVYEAEKEKEFTVYATKLAQRLLSYLTMPLPEGPGYQVDTRLRPEGRKGPLSVPRSGFINYYAFHAQLWEKLAITRIDYIAGDQRLAQEIMDEIKDLLSKTNFDEKEAKAIRDMRFKMERERSQKDFINLKVGYGGIADIEFLVQWLILKNLSLYPEIFTGNVLKAINYLLEIGILSYDVASFLKKSYEFLRTLDQKLILLLDKPGEEKHYTPQELEVAAPYVGDAVFQQYQEIVKKNRYFFEKLVV